MRKGKYMPVLDKPVNTRLEILKILYKLSQKRPDVEVVFFAAQISGGYYSEIYHQLRFLQEKRLVNFKRNMISKRFKASLSKSGLDLIEDAYKALELSRDEKDEALKEVFGRLKL